MFRSVTISTTAVLLVGILAAGPASAEMATPEEMENVCRNWLSYIVDQTGDWAGDPNPSIAGVTPLTAGDTVLALCFSIRPRGHVVVPVLKELPPVKAYSEKCGIDPDRAVGYPEFLREILRDRTRRFVERYGGMDAVEPESGERLFDRVNREEWGRFAVGEAEFASAVRGGAFAPLTEAGPLLSTSWHQQEPYNDLCPMGDGDRCVAGCGVTALSQIMNFHRWPPTGVGSRSYYWSGDHSCGGSTPGDTLFADFSDPYDWANMPDSCYFGGEINECVPIQSRAAAELNYELGVSLTAGYGACGTVTAFTDAMLTLPVYFKYRASISAEYRVNHTPESWFAVIQEEINAGRPMLYAIPYHAIVCDGWRDTGGLNQYHMNYGWAGWQTGWYVLDNLYMSSDPLQEGLIRKIRPAGVWTITVEADGSGAYPTIQAAVDAAEEGEIIQLGNGVYSGEGNRDVDFSGKAITIRSVNGSPDSCIVDCEGLGRGFLFQSGEGPGSYLESITIVNGYGGNGGAIYCDSASPTLARCVIRENSAAQSGGGVYCTGGSSPQMVQCTFAYNSAIEQGAGVACDGASSPDVDHSILAFGAAGEAVGCEGGSAAALHCCDVYGNAGGDWVGCIAGQFGVDGNFGMDPLFCDPESGDLSVDEDSPCASDNSGPDCGWIGALKTGCASTGVAGATVVGPKDSGLLANIPNPFNPATEITYSIPGGRDPSRVSLVVYDVRGRRVRILQDAEQSGGEYAVGWDGRDGDGIAVASGVYFCRLTWNGKSETRRVVLLK